MKTKGTDGAGSCCCFCAGLDALLAIVQHSPTTQTAPYLRYSMPPVPTLLTVKLLPSLVFVGSSFLGSLVAFCDRCRSISVLFFTRFSELLRLLLPCLRVDSGLAEFVFSARVSGATYADGGFFAAKVLVLEVLWGFLLRDEPVICLATAGSTDMKDSSLTRDDARGMSSASVDRIERVCCQAQLLCGVLTSDAEQVARSFRALITASWWPRAWWSPKVFCISLCSSAWWTRKDGRLDAIVCPKVREGDSREGLDEREAPGLACPGIDYDGVAQQESECVR